MGNQMQETGGRGGNEAAILSGRNIIYKGLCRGGEIAVLAAGG